MFWLVLLIGVLAGVTLGVLLVALCNAASESEDR
jgi:uncharacterized membrane-anchored protein YhcB (DUF1043 family)